MLWGEGKLQRLKASEKGKQGARREHTADRAAKRMPEAVGINEAGVHVAGLRTARSRGCLQGL